MRDRSRATFLVGPNELRGGGQLRLEGGGQLRLDCYSELIDRKSRWN